LVNEVAFSAGSTPADAVRQALKGVKSAVRGGMHLFCASQLLSSSFFQGPDMINVNIKNINNYLYKIIK